MNRVIILGNEYQLRGNSNYFKNKYGTRTPTARIDKGPFFVDESLLPENKKWWSIFNDKIINLGVAPMLYLKRAEEEKMPLSGDFFYSHIQNHGELIHGSEIGPQVFK